MKKRITSLVLAIVMAASSFSLSACGRDELKNKLEENELVEIVCNDPSHSHEEDSNLNNEVINLNNEVGNLTAELATAEADNADLTASNEELTKALEEAKKTVEEKVAEAQAEVTKLQEENDSLLKKIASYNEMVAANKKLQAAYDELVNLQESGWVVIGNKAYCRYEYAVKRTLKQLSDGTWYHQAKAQVSEVILYDDIIIGGNTMVYLDKTVEMARRDWTIAISFDAGKAIYSASIGNYKWSESAAFQGGVLKTGYELVETDKNGNFGRQDTIAQYIIGYEINESAELGVDFYVKAGLFEANPVVCSVCYKQNCEGHCNICWYVLSKCICEVKTEYVDREVKVNYCGRCGELIDNCTCETETVEVKVNYCGRCGELIDNCTCETETVEVKVNYCGRCGELINNCTCETETVEVKVNYCGRCGELIDNCTCEAETVEVKVNYCGRCGELIDNCTCEAEIIEVEVRVDYCGKCGNLLDDCTCGASDHNDLEDVEDPNPSVEPGHNELENIENPNQSGGNNNNGSQNQSSHSPLDD